jgi:2-isopropylmalate synthase
VVNLRIVAGTWGPQTAELELSIDGEIHFDIARGDGPVDAVLRVIKKVFPHEAVLDLYQVHAVTAGADAQAEVSVRLEENGKTVTGRGADTDTLVASAKAYVNALNKLLVKREKSAPEALTIRG